MLTSDLRPLTSVSVPGSPAWLPASLRERAAPVNVSFRWSSAERNVFRKRKPVAVSDWAERHRVVTRGPLQGSRFRRETQPALCDIMDAAYFPGVQYITVCASPQTGKSFVVDTCIGYGIDRDPGPVLYVYPDENTGTENLRDRIIPMIKQSVRLRSYMTKGVDDVSGRRVNLQHMQLYIGWSGSPTSLGNKSIKHLVQDEVDKYPRVASKKEASPIDLAEARTTVYRYMGRKIWKVSTPTTPDGPIWVSLMTEVQVIFDRFVCCPDCGTLQLMEFGQIKWPEEVRDPELILAGDLAWYECIHCGSRWSDHKRNAAVRFGKWLARPRTEDGRQREEAVQLEVRGQRSEVSEKQTEQPLELLEYLRKHKPLKIGFHLPSWVSRWVGLSEVAAAFLKSKGDRVALRNWNNKHRAMPWKDWTIERQEDKILRLRDDRPSGIVPSGGKVAALVAGVDTQDNGFYYRVRAFGWGLEQESWGVSLGFVDSFEALRRVLFDHEYRDVDGLKYVVRLAVQDSQGHKTTEVYDFVRMRQGRMWAAQGVDTRRMSTPLSWSNIEFYPGTKKPIPGGIRLLRHDANHWKQRISDKLNINPEDPGAFHLEAEATEEYARHLCAEHLDPDKQIWVCPAGRPNHYWDCEVLCFVAAEVLMVRRWPKPEVRGQKSEVRKEPQEQSGWFKGVKSEDWFGKR